MRSAHAEENVATELPRSLCESSTDTCVDSDTLFSDYLRSRSPSISISATDDCNAKPTAVLFDRTSVLTPSTAPCPAGSLPLSTVAGHPASVNDCGALRSGNQQIHPSTSATCTATGGIPAVVTVPPPVPNCSAAQTCTPPGQ